MLVLNANGYIQFDIIIEFGSMFNRGFNVQNNSFSWKWKGGEGCRKTMLFVPDRRMEEPEWTGDLDCLLKLEKIVYIYMYIFALRLTVLKLLEIT